LLPLLSPNTSACSVGGASPYETACKQINNGRSKRALLNARNDSMHVRSTHLPKDGTASTFGGRAARKQRVRAQRRFTVQQPQPAAVASGRVELEQNTGAA
jgi:hypothetical protein